MSEVQQGRVYTLDLDLADEELLRLKGHWLRWKGREIQWFYADRLTPWARAMLLAEMSSLGFSFVTVAEGAWYFSKPTE